MENSVETKRGFGTLTGLQKFYTVSGIVLCLCAIAEFIVWIIDAGRDKFITEQYFGIGFLAMSVCALLFLIVRPSSRKCANWIAAIGVIAILVLGIIGISLG